MGLIDFLFFYLNKWIDSFTSPYERFKTDSYRSSIGKTCFFLGLIFFVLLFDIEMFFDRSNFILLNYISKYTFKYLGLIFIILIIIFRYVYIVKCRFEKLTNSILILNKLKEEQKVRISILISLVVVLSPIPILYLIHYKII